jgi:hypothetical protein
MVIEGIEGINELPIAARFDEARDDGQNEVTKGKSGFVPSD